MSTLVIILVEPLELYLIADGPRLTLADTPTLNPTSTRIPKIAFTRDLWLPTVIRTATTKGSTLPMVSNPTPTLRKPCPGALQVNRDLDNNLDLIPTTTLEEDFLTQDLLEKIYLSMFWNQGRSVFN